MCRCIKRPTLLAYRDGYVTITDNTTTESPFWNSEEWAFVEKA